MAVKDEPIFFSKRRIFSKTATVTILKPSPMDSSRKTVYQNQLSPIKTISFCFPNTNLGTACQGLFTTLTKDDFHPMIVWFSKDQVQPYTLSPLLSELPTQSDLEAEEEDHIVRYFLFESCLPFSLSQGHLPFEKIMNQKKYLLTKACIATFTQFK